MENNLNILVAALGQIVHDMSDGVRKAGKRPEDNRHIVRLQRTLEGARLIADGHGDRAREKLMGAIHD